MDRFGRSLSRNLSNDSKSENGTVFSFRYNNSTDEYGYQDENGDFVAFKSGGTDVSDTTATASTVLQGYDFYLADGTKTSGTYVPLDTSDATATAKNIEIGFSAYVNGVKINGIATGIVHGNLKSVAMENSTYSRGNSAAVSIGNYALFAGGGSGSTSRESVEVYDSFLTHGVASNLSNNSEPSAYGGTVGNYALIGTGETTSNNKIDTFDTSLVKGTIDRLVYPRGNMGISSIGDYVLFAGGYSTSSEPYIKKYVEAYSSSLVRRTITVLLHARSSLAGASVGNYALFGGGTEGNSEGSGWVDSYDSSLTRSNNVNGLGFETFGLAGVSFHTANRAIFAGGQNYYNGSYIYWNDAVSFNTSLTFSVLSTLTRQRTELAATSIEYYALFAGGVYGGNGYYNTVDAYDNSLTRINDVSLSAPRTSLKGTSIGGYALFCGGQGANSTTQYLMDCFCES